MEWVEGRREEDFMNIDEDDVGQEGELEEEEPRVEDQGV
jgi:hypothetical protein